MLIDDVTIKIKAGDGGSGSVAFNKNMMHIGPTGGSGGNGGSIYLEGVSDLGALRQFRFRKALESEKGQDGRGQFRDGRDGRDLVLKVPVGTVVHNPKINQDSEIIRTSERLLVAKGGHGGKGNFLFRSPRNTTPEQFQLGLAGESFELRLELKLIADVGFIGFPNAGKSSLLNELTNAHSKVANYPFTTLEPNLGVYYSLILADIPGLIEGASEGKGLGTKFLRHVDRTKILFHLISAESETPGKDYAIIRAELKKHNPALLKKPEHVFLSKSDLVDAKTLKKRLSDLKRRKIVATPLSIHDLESIEYVQGILNKIKDAK